MFFLLSDDIFFIPLATLSYSFTGFLNYFEACRAGLEDVSPRLRLGGPGGSCRNPSFSRMCWALLDHCDRRAPARCLDYISIHKKGEGRSVLVWPFDYRLIDCYAWIEGVCSLEVYYSINHNYVVVVVGSGGDSFFISVILSHPNSLPLVCNLSSPSKYRRMIFDNLFFLSFFYINV